MITRQPADSRYPEDEELVESLAQGDSSALVELYRRHSAAATALAGTMMGPSGRAQDVVQDIFLLLWTNPHRYDPSRGTVRSYLLTMTKSRARSELRADAARTRREERSAQREIPHDPDRDHEAALADLLSHAIDRLPAPQGQAIILAYFGDHSYSEVARMLDVPHGTVNGRIRLGLQRLREQLATTFDQQSVSTIGLATQFAPGDNLGHDRGPGPLR